MRWQIIIAAAHVQSSCNLLGANRTFSFWENAELQLESARMQSLDSENDANLLCSNPKSYLLVYGLPYLACISQNIR